MDIKNAAREWNVSVKTVLSYIEKKYIIGISVENDEIIVPSIPKPYIKRKPKTVSDVDKYIRNTLDHNGYANYRIIGIEDKVFKERLQELTNANLIKQRDPENSDYQTTLNYMLVASVDKAIVISPTIAPTIELKVADQIGLVNTQIANL